MVEMAFYQQEAHIRETYAQSHANILDLRLDELKEQDTWPDWNALLAEAYAIVNDSINNEALLGYRGAMVFIWVEEKFYVYGTDMQTFLNTVDDYQRQCYEYDNVEPVDFSDRLRELTWSVEYTKGEDGILLAWYPFGSGEYRVGMFVPNAGALRMSEGLRELMDTEKTVENMTNTARQAVLGVLIVVAILLVVLPLASRRLALVVVNPVESE